VDRADHYGLVDPVVNSVGPHEIGWLARWCGRYHMNQVKGAKMLKKTTHPRARESSRPTTGWAM
jgi:hypothetical protein